MQYVLTLWVTVAHLVWGNIEVICKYINKGVHWSMLYLQGASALVNNTEETADQNQNSNGINLRELQGDNSDLNPLIKGATI